MDYRGGKRSSISFGSYQRPMEQFQNAGGGIYQRQSPMLYHPRSLEVGAPHAYCADLPSPQFAVDWDACDRVAIGSYKEDAFNKLTVLQATPDLSHWDSVAQASVIYPLSKIQWMPKGTGKLATCSDSLRIWSVEEQLHEQLNLSLVKYGKSLGEVSNGRMLGQLPPVTSFDWNALDTNLILSSSIDTTCTVWDLQASNYVKTQLIAHDSEVFDAKFLTQSSNLFASCGGDGSVRVFDLRCLAHSTIIYEPQQQVQGQTPSQTQVHTLAAHEQDGQLQKNSQSSALSSSASSSLGALDNCALLRLEPSPFDPNILATIQQDSNVVIILDMRYPGSPMLLLEGHAAPVNQLKWHPSKPNVLATCGDDCQILYWDLLELLSASQVWTGLTQQRWSTTSTVRTLETPQMSYTAQYEVNNFVWRPSGDWIGYTAGKRFYNIRM
ncbi:AFL157Cp [Eremothecium gossypii ATCC 10895]|uniref:AFL157Cp n=1 Tax=Eremothecium gossypii (strain ATCC 10895 / CBS 109.51 / FGSC 9923 / NRRL Y-1056) TaxID=284811 RepID=Q755I0_EREGS|nr:AFL157Cp [Eremothecium gossypii ATCC 10895]AAS53217.2 AFL157Cp [Eremothecium gossypii ATCC 10895]AEY97527.1 FAFL157Cp [Eremothecium gossypii FDAG1]